jgi:hypothetical protein
MPSIFVWMSSGLASRIESKALMTCSCMRRRRPRIASSRWADRVSGGGATGGGSTGTTAPLDSAACWAFVTRWSSDIA